MMVYSVHTKNLFPGGNSISRRHGALNIGGNLCRIGNEAFMGFIGILDEVSYLTSSGKQYPIELQFYIVQLGYTGVSLHAF